MGRPPCWALCLALLTAIAYAQDCPVTFKSPTGSLLFGGLKRAQCRLQSNGKQCPPRNSKWVEACKNDPNEVKFGVCSFSQRLKGLRMAQRLHNGAPTRLSPCDLFPYLRGRTLWLIGDSHSKQLFLALQCFLIDFSDGRDCTPSGDPAIQKQLDKLPVMPGSPRCFNLVGSGRVCLIHAVLGTSLLNNSQVAGGGVLSLLRDKGVAKREDIFLPSFGVWHAKRGAAGIADHRRALQTLGDDFRRNKAKWPYMIWREVEASHDKDAAHGTCLPAASGWEFDPVSGRLSLMPNARSERASLIVRGGTLNAAAREILPRYGLPIMKGYDYSVPMYSLHPGTRGTTELDCLHFCHNSLPELLVYELQRTLSSGVAGVKPLRLSGAAAQRRLPCTPIPAPAPAPAPASKPRPRNPA